MICFVFKCHNNSYNVNGVFLEQEQFWICEPCFEFITTGKNNKHKFCQIRKNANDLEIREKVNFWCQ